MSEVTLFNIQHFSVHDGPGIRTVVFFKGCPLRCPWCSNPESQSPRPELQYEARLCQRCGKCLQACPNGALSFGESGLVVRDASRCEGCFKCAAACRPRALKAAGWISSVGDAVKEVNRDAVFYRRQGGGVTLSGGEPLAQPEAALELLRACRSLNIRTALETCLAVPEETVEAAIPLVDFFYCDFKLADEERHRRLTGAGNELIKRNIKRIAESGKTLVVRYPLIPGINDSEEDLRAFGSWLSESCPGTPAEILAYHRFGLSKYDMLWRPYSLPDVKEPDAEALGRAAETVRSCGVSCTHN